MVEQILDASQRRTSFPASPDGSLKDVCRPRAYPAQRLSVVKRGLCCQERSVLPEELSVAKLRRESA
jgi:hypothetical protein